MYIFFVKLNTIRYRESKLISGLRKGDFCTLEEKKIIIKTVDTVVVLACRHSLDVFASFFE